MTIELKMLIGAIILGLIQMFLTGVAGTAQHGQKYAMSSRDEQLPLTGRWARVGRAFKNFLETFAFFASAVLITQILGVHNKETMWGAELYLFARIAYLPIYVFDIIVVRTLVWLASVIGIVMILAAVCCLH